MDGIRRLVEIIEEIARGNYSDDVMALTKEEQPEQVRTIAEAMGLMMVKVEAREYRLEMMVEELKMLNLQIKENAIKTVSAMANALAARDAYTEGHAARVEDLAGRMASRIGLEARGWSRSVSAGSCTISAKLDFPICFSRPRNSESS